MTLDKAERERREVEFWRLSSGHHLNWLCEAHERIDELEAQVERLQVALHKAGANLAQTAGREA